MHFASKVMMLLAPVSYINNHLKVKYSLRLFVSYVQQQYESRSKRGSVIKAMTVKNIYAKEAIVRYFQIYTFAVN